MIGLIKTKKRSLSLFLIVLAIAACTQYFEPVWQMSLEGGGTKRIFASPDNESIIMISNDNSDLMVQRYDLSGKLIDEQILEDSYISFLTLNQTIETNTKTVYLAHFHHPTFGFEEMLRFDLDTYELTPAFPAEFYEKYSEIYGGEPAIEADGSLVLAGGAKSITTGEIEYYIGRLTPDGDFEYQIIEEALYTTKAISLHGSDQYALVAHYFAEQQEITGYRSRVIFYDASLEVINSFDLENSFTASWGFEDRLWGHYGGVGPVFFMTDGSIETTEVDYPSYSNNQVFYHDDWFYFITTRYEDALGGADAFNDICRFTYSIEPLNCFQVNNKHIEDIQILANGDLGMSTIAKRLYANGGAIDLNKAETTISANATLLGYDETQVYHMVFAPDGTEKLKIQRKPFRGHGPITLSNFDVFYPLIRDYTSVERGVQGTHSTVFFDSERLATISVFSDYAQTFEFWQQ